MSNQNYEETTTVMATPAEVFAYLDDPTRIASHMGKSSWMMGGGRMDVSVDEGRGQKVGSHIRLDGTAFGLRVFLDEKAGGFNLYRERNGDPRFGPNSGQPGAVSVDSDTRFDKEVVDSYELGVKSQWADSRLTVNGALFHQTYENFQLNTFTGLQFVVTALPKVVSKGVDLDALWHTPINRLSVQGGLTYADTTIEDFGAAIAFFRPERDGDTLSYAPRWSGAVSATYERGLSARLGFRASVGARYTSEYNTGSNLDPRKNQPSMTLVNARVGIGSADNSWAAEVWANNLTGVDYYQLAIDASLQGSSAGAVPTSTIDAYLGAPRTYGLTLRKSF